MGPIQESQAVLLGGVEGRGMEVDTVLWGLGAAVAVLVLVRLADRRRRDLRALLYDYVQRQLLWIRRKQKAAEMKAAKKQAESEN